MGGEWQNKLLGNVIELKRGYDLPKRLREKGGIPLISSAGFSDFHKESKVKGPGVVTGRYGTIGKVFYSESDFWPLNTTLYVRDFMGNDPKFVYYFLKTINYLQYSDKAAVPGVNRNHLHMAEVSIPCEIPEQKAIAHVLGSLDDRIELNRRMNETLEGMAQALFKSWFVDFDPVLDNAITSGKEIPPELKEKATARSALGDKRHPLPKEIRTLFPNEFTYSDELGWIPKGWEVKTVSDELETVGGGTPRTKDMSFWEGGIYAFCTPKDMSNLTSKILLKTDRLLTKKGVAKISSGQLPKGTVLMSSRAPIGYIAINDLPVSINQGIIAIKRSAKYREMFLLGWVHFNMGKINERANGSTFLEISKKNFRLIPFLVPDAEIMESFNEHTKTILTRLVLCTKKSDNLTKLRDTLLPKLLSGEIRIPDAEKMVEGIKG